MDEQAAILEELQAIREELSYIARDVLWIATAGCQTDDEVARRERFLDADGNRRIALLHDSDAVGREKVRDRLAQATAVFRAERQKRYTP